MKKILDYRTQSTKRWPIGINSSTALTISVIEHLAIFMFYAPSLDGGRRMRMCAAVALGYWVVALMILARRRDHLTLGDFLFLTCSLPPMTLLCILAVTGHI